MEFIIFNCISIKKKKIKYKQHRMIENYKYFYSVGELLAVNDLQSN